LQGIESVLTPRGLAMVVAETKQIRAAGDDLVNYLDDKRADGVIVLDGGLSAESLAEIAQSKHSKQVIFACEWVEGIDFPSVRSSNYQGAIRAVEHLHQLGHRHVAHVAGPVDNVLTAERLNGFLEACKNLGIEHEVIDGEFSMEAGAEAADRLMALPEQPSAVFCASDTIAIGLISALAQRGLRTPQDISVMGFDDIELCEHFVPPLTSIRQDRIALGAHAARLLIRCLTSDALSDHIERLPVDLVQRASCAAVVS